MDLESLSYGLQKNILEKMTYEQFAAFNECSNFSKILCDTNPGLKFPADDRNDNVYVHEEVIVIGANEIKRPFNDSSQYFFTNVDYLIGQELTDELWLQLINCTKGCSWLEIDYPVRTICSPEMFARFVNETGLSNLIWNRPIAELVPYDTSKLELVFANDFIDGPLDVVFLNNPKELDVGIYAPASELFKEIKRQLKSSKISTKKEFRNSDFTKEEVEEALLTFGDACQIADPNDYEFEENTLCCWKIYGNSLDDHLILVSFRSYMSEYGHTHSYILIQPFD